MIGRPPLGAGVGMLDIAREGVLNDISSDSNFLDVWFHTLSNVPHLIGLSAQHRWTLGVMGSVLMSVVPRRRHHEHIFFLVVWLSPIWPRKRSCDQ